VAETQELATGIKIELQESETPDAATPPPSNKVAKTQPTTHPADETQELATDIEIWEIETPNVATQHPVAETQEPAIDIDIEIQESEARRILFFQFVM
jgi:hypothetical protein